MRYAILFLFILHFTVALRAQAPFGRQQVITYEANGAQSVFAADVDGDGDIDVLSASKDDHDVAWHENNGATPPEWTKHIIAGLVYGAPSVHAADMDGDGDLDVLSGSVAHTYLLWFENDGSPAPNWTPHTIDSDFGPDSIVAADLDADGDTDLASVQFAGDHVAWWENDGAITPAWTRHTVAADLNGPREIRAADVNGDGLTDLVVAAYWEQQFIRYQNDGATPPAWTAQVIDSGIYATSAVTTDWDEDGDLDVLGGSHSLAWYENDGAPLPGFKPSPIDDGGFVSSMFVADVDLDGDPDLFYGRAPYYIAGWYENLNGSSEVVHRNILLGDPSTQSTFAADLDGDGDKDFLSAHDPGGKIVWYENRLGAPLIENPEPGFSGAVNTFKMTGFTPNSPVGVAWSKFVGAKPVPTCPGVTLDLGNRIFRLGPGLFKSDSGGDLSVSRFVPSSVPYIIYMQALDVATCTPSGLLTFTFR